MSIGSGRNFLRRFLVARIGASLAFLCMKKEGLFAFSEDFSTVVVIACDVFVSFVNVCARLFYVECYAVFVCRVFV